MDGQLFSIETYAATLDEVTQYASLGQTLGCVYGNDSCLHQPDAVRKLKSQFYVVGREEYRLLLPMGQPAQQLHDFYLAGKVQKGRRLIQEDDFRLLCQRFGYHHLLPLAVAKCMHQSWSQRLYAYLSDGFADHLLR